MSNNRDIYEALYASSDGVVVRRHKSAAVPAAMFIMIFVGGIMALARVYGSGHPFHTAEGRFLKVEELHFAKDKSSEVARLVREGNFDALRSLSHDGVSAVTVTLFSSPSGAFRAGQAFEYMDLEMRPITDLKIVQA